MRVRILATLLLFTALPTLAQNSDVGLLFNLSRTRFDLGPRTQTEYQIGLQVNYARQLAENAKGRLYAEFPITSGNTLFFTPGLRYHWNLSPRVAVYAAAGIGLSSRKATISELTFDQNGKATGAVFRSEQRVSGAYNVGAGLDLRLTRLMSVRTEFRRFRADAQPGVLVGRTFPSVQAGFALHF